MTEAQANALQTIISEFQNLCPEITNAFIFKTTGEIVASDSDTSYEQRKCLVEALNCLSSKAEIIGNIKMVFMHGADHQLSVTSKNNQYLATVYSTGADEKIIKSLTGVLVPTVAGLVDELSEIGSSQVAEPAEKLVAESILPTPEPLSTETIPQEQTTFNPEPFLPEPPVTQFMVEKIGGLLVAPDIVRVNSDVIANWIDIYGKKKITEIHIETLEGKAITCKFKAVKETNSNSQGVIQIPEKILQTLQTSKGKLVIAKPVIN